MNIDIAALGITKEDLIDRVVKNITDLVMTAEMEEDGVTFDEASPLAERLSAHVVDAVNAKVEDLAARFVVPQVADLIETFSLQRTNSWGEKTGEPVTFIEYLTQRADAYLREEVDSDGRSREECSRSGRPWYGSKGQARIAYMIDKHLHYSISTAMQQALQTANSAIVGGIESTIKAKLAELQKGIQISVKVKD